MNKLLNGKVILLTGGGQGIGRECALAYSREGAHVAVVDINRAAAEETVSLLEQDGMEIECDVGDAPSVKRTVDQVLDRFRRLDAIHNNAGIVSPSSPLHETTEHEWDEIHRVNLKSVYLTTRFGIESLMASKGSILNTASMVGMIGQANHAAYVSTKGAMISLTKAMALDYAEAGVRVNAISPAGVWTPMLRKWTEEQPERVQIEQFLDQAHALGYCPEGDVIADAAVFLLSDMARFMTGVILPVSGGAELGYRRILS